MGWKFNPFTGALDQTGSTPSSYIDGEVSTYNDLPLSSTTAPLNTAWLVRGSSGVWPFTKPGGVYIRTATGGSSRDADYTYAGVFPDVFSDANFTLYDDSDTSKNLKFQLSGISTGTTRTLTVPNASGRIQVEGQPIGNTTPSTGAFTTLSASGAITAAAGTTGTPTTPATALGVQWSGLGGLDIAAVYGTYAGAGKVGIGVGTSGIITEVASFALGGIALNRSVAANNGTLTASAPVLDLSQTWNNSAVTFTGLRVNVTNTASATASSIADFQLGGTSIFNVRRDGAVLASSYFRFRDLNAGMFQVSVGGSSFALGSSPDHWALFTSTRCALTGDLSIGRSGSLGQTYDTILSRDAAATLAQRDGTNAQTFRLYSTFTSATSFERLNIIAQSAASVIIGTEKGSGGGTARGLELRTDNTARITIGSAGQLGFFGATAAAQPTAVADATDAATVITQLNALLSRMRTLGLIAT